MSSQPSPATYFGTVIAVTAVQPVQLPTPLGAGGNTVIANQSTTASVDLAPDSNFAPQRTSTLAAGQQVNWPGAPLWARVTPGQQGSPIEVALLVQPGGSAVGPGQQQIVSPTPSVQSVTWTPTDTPAVQSAVGATWALLQIGGGLVVPAAEPIAELQLLDQLGTPFSTGSADQTTLPWYNLGPPVRTSQGLVGPGQWGVDSQIAPDISAGVPNQALIVVPIAPGASLQVECVSPPSISIDVRMSSQFGPCAYVVPGESSPAAMPTTAAVNATTAGTYTLTVPAIPGTRSLWLELTNGTAAIISIAVTGLSPVTVLLDGLGDSALIVLPWQAVSPPSITTYLKLIVSLLSGTSVDLFAAVSVDSAPAPPLPGPYAYGSQFADTYQLDANGVPETPKLTTGFISVANGGTMLAPPPWGAWHVWGVDVYAPAADSQIYNDTAGNQLAGTYCPVAGAIYSSPNLAGQRINGGLSYGAVHVNQAVNVNTRYAQGL